MGSQVKVLALLEGEHCCTSPGLHDSADGKFHSCGSASFLPGNRALLQPLFNDFSLEDLKSNETYKIT